MRIVLPLISLLAIALLVFYLTSDPSDGRAVESGGRTSAVDASDSVELQSIAGLDGAEERSSPERSEITVEVSPAAPLADAAGGVATEGGTVLRGRVLLPEGAPAPGVSLIVDGWEANNERVAEFGLPEDWEDIEASTAGDGSFEIRFDAPQAYQFVLEIHLEGFVPVSWRWGSLPVEGTVDVGDVTLAAGGAIEVHVVGPDGRSVGTDWTVYGRAEVEHSGAGKLRRDEVQRIADFDPAGGAWLLTDLPIGPVEISAYGQLSGWTEDVDAVVEPGRTVSVDLVHDGPDLSRSVVVNLFSRPVYTLSPEGTSVMLVGPLLAAPIRCEIEGPVSTCTFHDLAPGTYTVVVDDPDFLRVEREGVQPGQRVDIRVRGSAALVVDVFDSDRETELETWSATVRAEGTNSWPKEFPVVIKGESPPEDGRIGSLPPLDYTLIVEAPGYPELSVSVPGLAAGEERPVRVEYSSRFGVGGLVTESGRPVPAGVEVELYRAAILEQEPDWWTVFGRDLRDSHRIGVARTDEQGRFQVGPSATGDVVVRAVGGAGRHALLELTVDVDAGAPEVELALPAGCTVRGRLSVPPGESLENLSVMVGESEIVSRGNPIHWDPEFDPVVDGTLEPGGTFRLDACPRVPLSFAVVDWDAGVVLYRAELEPPAAGDLVHDVDLTDVWPGEVTFRLAVAGEPLAKVSLGLEAVESGMRSDFVGTDADGRASLQVAGGDYRIHVWARQDGGWTWEPEQSWYVEPGASSEWTVEVPAYRHELELVDATTAEPLRDAEVVMWRPASTGDVWPHPLRTDGDGALVLRRLAGEFWISRALEPEGARALADMSGFPRVAWGPGTPEPSVIAVP